MPKYLCELSLLTRSTALVVVESDHEPNRGDLREAYAQYADNEWNDDPEYAEEGQHGMLGRIDGNSFPGINDLSELPVFRVDEAGGSYIDGEVTVIADVQDLADHLGAEPTETSIARRIYKVTECGAWLKITDDATAIEIGSIVEGVEQSAGPEVLSFPFTVDQFDAAVQSIEDEVSEIWNATHGCDECGPEDEAGYRHVNPVCSSCGGTGIVI